MFNFLLTRYDAAYNDFSSALLYLRGKQFINYEQLGLKLKLFSAEVLFNRGLTQIYMGQLQEGLADMQDGQRERPPRSTTSSTQPSRTAARAAPSSA